MFYFANMRSKTERGLNRNAATGRVRSRMQHNEHLLAHAQMRVGGKALVARANGRFYMPEFLAERLAEVAEFRTAQTATVKEFKQGAVSHTERVGDIEDGEQRCDLRERERRRGQALFHAGQFKFAGGVVQDDVLSGEPAEPVLEGAQPCALRVPAETLPVCFDTSPQPSLIRLQDGAGDLRGLFQLALGGPAEEDLQRIAPAFQRAFGVVAGSE